MRVFVLLAAATLGSCGERIVTTSAPLRYDQEGRALGLAPRLASPPNLVLIVVDALRADALPDGAEPATRMPSFAALAERGVQLDNATAPATWTLPSITSILTGLRPLQHGLDSERSVVQLPDAITTFAEVLSATYGYATAAFVAGPWFEGRGESVLQGFERIEHDYSLQGTAELVGRWTLLRRGRPFFLLLHTYDVHSPYGAANHPWPPRPLGSGRTLSLGARPLPSPEDLVRIHFLDGPACARLVQEGDDRADRAFFDYLYNGYPAHPDPVLCQEIGAGYWSGVRWADDQLGTTLDYLRSSGLLQNTLLVVTSDHGESLGEHGILGHGRTLQESLVHVPLVATGPGPFAKPRHVANAVSLLDVLPTFLDLAGMAPLAGGAGRSFLPAMDAEPVCRAVVSQERLTFENTFRDVDEVLVSARTPRWKYVLRFDARRGAARESLYDLLFDPDEEIDLFAKDQGDLGEAGIDACACAAVEALRDALWRFAPHAAADDDVAVPYASHPTGPTTQRPPPCDAP